MSQRFEFCVLALQADADVRGLCRRFGISPKTGYKWLARYRKQPQPSQLVDRSRRPLSSPGKTVDAMESLVVKFRQKHPAWGGRKIHVVLSRDHAKVPRPSTITDILRRHDLIDPDQARQHKPPRRFEHERPNDLWQMDFLGDFATATRRCHPLTIIDDHSRYALATRGCDNQRETTVKSVLGDVFCRHGLPRRILCDNGAPWGSDTESKHTRLTVWLMRLGVEVTHGRPRHPQTQGKDERFNRTVNVELVSTRVFEDVDHFNRLAEPWRMQYNTVRPHEALGMAVPADRYRPAERSFPTTLPPIEYDVSDIVRKVDSRARISYQNRPITIGKAFIGQPIALRPTLVDGVMTAYFCHCQIKEIDLREQATI